MSYKFTKMHGCGNDYIYFDCLEGEGSVLNPHEPSLFWLCDRNKGIGGDGIVLILPSDAADARMQMFNADGSEGLMCGNAIRCVAEYLHTTNHVQTSVNIETASGIKTVSLAGSHMWRVDMGRANLEKASSIHIGGKEYRFTKVDVGNPHAVVFVETVDDFDVAGVGVLFEHDKAFLPHRINTEFVEVIERNHLKMRVWERGSGETLACGTGACAAAAAAIQAGHCDMDTDIKVELLGGELIINCTDEAVYMTGEAVRVFDGHLF